MSSCPSRSAAASLLACGALAIGLASLGADGSAAAEGSSTLDYAFYKERVAPIVHRICAECHADPRKRLGKHFLRPVQGRTPREADHRRNFETLQALITPGDPSKSLWLLKPLGPRQGGVEHKGGEKIRFDSVEYATMVQFINGARLPAKDAVVEDPAARAPGVPEIGIGGLRVQVEDFAREGEVSATPDEGAEGLVVRATSAGAVLTQTVLAPEDRAYEILFRAKRGDPERPSFSLRIDGRAPLRVDVPGASFSDVGPRVPCDGAEPLAEAAGDLVVEEGRLRMRGTATAPARWVTPWAGEHRSLEAVVDLPSEEDGGDDALLLFDASDPAKAKYVGLVDGGRRFVIGVIDGGRPRAIDSADAPPPTEPTPAPVGSEASAAPRPRRVGVEYVDGVAVGRLDGKPLVHANLDSALGTKGRFGLLSHGALVVREAAAQAAYEVHRVRFGERPVVALSRGPHVVRVELAAGGPALDVMILRSSAP